MAGIAFDVLLETGVLVQAFPMWDGDLAHPQRFTNPSLIQSAAIAALSWAGVGATQDHKTHSGLIANFGLRLVQTGRLSAELGRSLNRVQELRLAAPSASHCVVTSTRTIGGL
jgi:hypothetical protein